MLWTVIAFERFCDHVLAVLHATMAQPRQGQGVSFARKDRIQNFEATDSRDVVKYPMNLKVHLVKSLLHMQDMLGCHLDQATAMAPERSYRAYESRWSKTGT